MSDLPAERNTSNKMTKKSPAFSWIASLRLWFVFRMVHAYGAPYREGSQLLLR